VDKGGETKDPESPKQTSFFVAKSGGEWKRAPQKSPKRKKRTIKKKKRCGSPAWAKEALKKSNDQIWYNRGSKPRSVVYRKTRRKEPAKKRKG